MYTLIVVDMQPSFRAANNTRVAKNCLREINEAVRVGAHIIFLEFCGHESTLCSLMKAVKGYDNYAIECKDIDDGSAEVQRAVKKRGFMIGRFRVVGVNTDWCVLSTARGIRRRFPNSFVEVRRDACSSDDDHAGGIKRIQKLDNVDVI